MIFVFVNVIGGDTASYHGKRIKIGVSADDSAGIENAVASDIRPVAEHRADLAKAGLHVLFSAVDHDVLLISLYVGCDGSCAHVCVKTEYAVAHIVVVRDFYFVEEYYVLEFGGISDSSAVSDDRAAADEGALPYSRVLINDAGSADICAVKYRRAFGNPDVIAPLFKSVFGQFIAKGDDKIADVLENFPRVCFALEKFSRDLSCILFSFPAGLLPASCRRYISFFVELAVPHVHLLQYVAEVAVLDIVCVA